jgi:hypothetical protein
MLLPPLEKIWMVPQLGRYHGRRDIVNIKSSADEDFAAHARRDDARCAVARRRHRADIERARASIERAGNRSGAPRRPRCAPRGAAGASHGRSRDPVSHRCQNNLASRFSLWYADFRSAEGARRGAANDSRGWQRRSV